MSGSVEWQLGEISARLRAIENRLEDGSKRHTDLDEADDELRARVAQLEMREATRSGVMAVVAAIGSAVGGLAVILINFAMSYVSKKF